MNLFKLFKKSEIKRVEEIVDRLQKALEYNKQERFEIESNLQRYRKQLEILKEQ